MKRMSWCVSLGLAVLIGGSVAEAGMSEWAPVRWVKNSVRYVWEPVNCPIALVNKLVVGHESAGGDLWDALACVGDNLNRVPTTLTPIIP